MALVSYSPTSLSKSGDQGATTDIDLKITNNYAGALDTMNVVFSNLVDGANTISSSQLSIPAITPTTSIAGGADLNTIVYVAVPTGTPAGTYDGTMELFGSVSAGPVLSRGTVNISFTVLESFCSNGKQGVLKISDFSVDNFGSGDDEEWDPLDKLEITVEVENTHNTESVRDVVVEMKILDDSGNDVTNDFDVADEKIDLGRIRDDDSETVTFEIKELPADVDEGNYRIYVKAYDENDEDNQCVDEGNDLNNNDYHEIEVVKDEDYAVVVGDVPEKVTASCGDDNVHLSFPVYNIGIDKEDNVLVQVLNRELGIDERVDVGSLREGKKKDVDVFLTIPDTASKSHYSLDVITYFEYDKDEDKMDLSSYDSNSFDDLDKNYEIDLEILGCKAIEPTVTARLESGAAVGEELVIRSTVTNNGGEANTFIVSVSGLGDWAELESVTPNTLSLDAGESQEVVVKVSPNKGGFQTFSIDTIVDGETYSQPVSVEISGKEGVFSGISNDVLYYALAVLVVLIIIFIIAIVRVSRRPSAQF